MASELETEDICRLQSEVADLERELAEKCRELDEANGKYQELRDVLEDLAWRVKEGLK